MTKTTHLILAMLAFLLAPVLARADVPLPTGGSLKQVDFERHVMGLLSKTGCNSGSCHGSFQGKNGFRLSLFGYEPAFDHAAITRDNLGRRVDVQNPENSLLLTKATGAISHEGSMRFSRGSWAYDVFQEWISRGASWSPGSGTVEKLTVTPSDFAIVPQGETLQIRVSASFADGTEEDITAFCDFRVSDDAIASASPLGLVTAARTGDAGLMILYRGSVEAIRVLVPAPPIKGGYPKVPAVNYIDQEVFAKLKLLNMVPSNLASDEQFLRRVTIDTIGQLPSPDDVREFLADKSPNKREKLIDRLLSHPLHSAIWATKLSDITGNSTDALERPIGLQPRRSQLWHEWLRKRVQDNVPYDQIVRDILTATSLDDMSPKEYIEFVNKMDKAIDPAGNANDLSGGSGFGTIYPEKKTLDLFWRRHLTVPIELWSEKVAAAFMGVRLECAQCHKHPTDRWTQEEYWAFANVFAQVTFFPNQSSSIEIRDLVEEENTARKTNYAKFSFRNNNYLNPVREMFVSDRSTGRARKANPATGLTPSPRALGGPEIPHESGKDTRAALAKWLTTQDNPYFARSFVNRVWAHYFGIGLVNPVDDFSVANPPTNPRLLDALARNFAESGFDLRKLERTLLMSRTYQLSYDDNPSNKFDTNNYSRAYIRPLMAEQVVDILNSALNVSEIFTGVDEAPAGTKMIEVGASKIADTNLAYVLRIFGRPQRTTACDCERALEPALPQALFRMTDQTLLAKFNDPKGRVRSIVQAISSSEEQVDELFLATLTRYPTPKEKADALAHMKTKSVDSKSQVEALNALLWALINTREFILNH